jgi:hypothetical protein
MAKRKKQDENEIAARILGQALGDVPKDEPAPKNPAAVALGRLGGLKGGKARAAKLNEGQRKEIAKKAAAKRWDSDQIGL